MKTPLPVVIQFLKIVSSRNLTDPEGKNLFLVCVTDLAIECRDFDLLFGKMQSTGVRSRYFISLELHEQLRNYVFTEESSTNLKQLILIHRRRVKW